MILQAYGSIWVFSRCPFDSSHYDLPSCPVAATSADKGGGGYQTPLRRVLYTPCSARAASLSTLLRLSRPFSDQGKWATGMRKKELLGSAIPARALYQAMKAAKIPNAPPAIMQPSCGAGLAADWPPLTR